MRYDVGVHQSLRSVNPCAALTAAASLFLLGCAKPPTATPPTLHDAATVTADMSRSVVAAAASPDAVQSPFALVAIESVEHLYRLLDGGVLAAASDVLYALDREGSARSLEPVFLAVRSVLGNMGRVGGSWPGALVVETFRLGSGDGQTISFVLRGDARQAKVERRLDGSYFLPPAVWKGGALPTVRAEGHSTLFGSALNRSARLEILGATKQTAPRFPKDALFDDAFVAYPSGFVFALGGRRTRPVVEDDASEYEQEHHYMIDGAVMWQTDGTAPVLQPVQLPDTSPRDRLLDGQLAPGKTAYDTLAFGTLEIWRQRQSTLQPYLARFDATGWRHIPIELPVLRVDTGSDATTWAIIGSDGYASTDESFLARVILTADGGVKFERVVLKPSAQWNTLDDAKLLAGCVALRPRELAAVSADDIWLTAQCVTGKDYPATVLLHTQAQKPLVTFKTLERSPHQ